MSEFASPETWLEAAFRDAAFFKITSFDLSGGKRRSRKGETKDWTEVRRCITALKLLNRTCNIYVVSKHGNAALLPPSCWDNLDRIWSETHGEDGNSKGEEGKPL